jgi:hypothetical protein
MQPSFKKIRFSETVPVIAAIPGWTGRRATSADLKFIRRFPQLIAANL